MRIISVNPGHDGHVAYIEDGSLVFSYEAEKDSGRRYAPARAEDLITAFLEVGGKIDCLGITGWARGVDPRNSPTWAGYSGEVALQSQIMPLIGNEIQVFSNSHERAHILSSYALSPFPQGSECYALVYEGFIGAFYHIDSSMKITKVGDVLSEPGIRYAFLYGLADRSFRMPRGTIRLGDAGKLMALVAFGKGQSLSANARSVIDYIMSPKSAIDSLYKGDLHHTEFYDAGLLEPGFVALAKGLSDAIFNRFATFAESRMKRGLPLLISGGCGLNCDWNTAWRETGLFSDVFVPPCTNDTGVGIGTAADAQFSATGSAKLNWSVYSGQAFVHDQQPPEEFVRAPLDYGRLCRHLLAGQVIAWVQGRCEIGPRALGNRSILAAPFEAGMTRRLNEIKQREEFRPIAPVCLESEAARLFGESRPSPYMLYFQSVRDPRLKAITHVDGTARIQTVSSGGEFPIWRLLNEFKALTGYGVLCNTSLNFKGTGFINRTSDVVRYVFERGLDGFVIDDEMFLTKSAVSQLEQRESVGAA